VTHLWSGPAKEQITIHLHTRNLLTQEDRFTQLTERDSGLISLSIMTILDHITRDKQNESTAFLRQVLKEITLVSGYRELPGLSPAQMDSLIGKIVSQVRNTP
jgi:hypothetical protein